MFGCNRDEKNGERWVVSKYEERNVDVLALVKQSSTVRGKNDVGASWVKSGGSVRVRAKKEL